MSHIGALKNQESSQNRKPISFIKKTTLGKIMMTQSGSVNFLNIHRITHTHTLTHTNIMNYNDIIIHIYMIYVNIMIYIYNDIDIIIF